MKLLIVNQYLTVIPNVRKYSRTIRPLTVGRKGQVPVRHEDSWWKYQIPKLGDASLRAMWQAPRELIAR